MLFIRNIVFNFVLGNTIVPEKKKSHCEAEKQINQAEETMKRWVRRREMGLVQTRKVQIDSSTFWLMWQMQIFTQTKDLSLSSINVVKKLKNNLCTFCPLMRFKYLQVDISSNCMFGSEIFFFHRMFCFQQGVYLWECEWFYKWWFRG